MKKRTETVCINALIGAMLRIDEVRQAAAEALEETGCTLLDKTASIAAKKEKEPMLYKHVLVAVDLIEECRAVADHALQLAKALDAKLSLLHVVEPLAMAYGGDVPMDLSMLQQQQFEQARERPDSFSGKYPELAADQRHLAYGQPRQEIHRLAEEQGCDLIVVGSHGRHGLALLLGSTANDVLHGAPCDVLAVRLKKPEKHFIQAKTKNCIIV